MGIQALLDTQVLTVTGSTGDVMTVQADGSYLAETPAGGGVGGSTGAVDNAVLRADGTGGVTLQTSAFTIADLATASPNNTVNNVSMAPTGGTTNVSVSIVPKGTGAFSLAVPDGTATGGNVRGANAVDLQTNRSSATQVASGTKSVAIGARNTAGTSGVAIGNIVTAGGSNSIAIGSEYLSAGNSSAIAIGTDCAASTYASMAVGRSSVSNRPSKYAMSWGRFLANGDMQFVRFILAQKTTSATPVTLACRTVFSSTDRPTITSGRILFADILISGILSTGASACCYKRKVAIKNVGGTTTLVGTVETIGTDIEDNAACDVAITADDTNDALDISVTGIAAETWRWVAVVEGLEIGYGT
jgi:hypothetical protein